ncbi:PREDICTED: vitamin D3 hydroxylase-associated protein-like [Ceratotherium simum simum]|uniref:fatty acid amide hydrolase n=1 Tax=Ceratotherium simum simum TaxID=73337 RepID=A0ABM1DHU1_CERSS|nr:PREDICTED: vitamin D3 hydroxylase-associated protein-like [Ceratotherium simum simum]
MQRIQDVLGYERLTQLLPTMKLDGRVITAILCGCGAGFLLRKWLLRRQLRKKIAKAQEQRARLLEQMKSAVRRFKHKHADIQSESILSLSLLELSEKLREGALSPENVLYTYMEQALKVNKELNCLTDFIPDCEEQLKELPKGKEKGLLYGVPVSLKEHFDYKNHVSSCGLVSFLGIPAKDDCVIVKVLKSQGAIPFVKTNVPQTMISYDSSNVIFGKTLHPQNPKKSPGGSSSGEGALIAGGGSILGLGSDLGGSIRVPSSFCGICGFKPTGSRLSLLGMSVPMDGMDTVTGTLGPMARDVDSLALCMRALLCEELFHLDPSVPPLSFNDEVYSSSKPLRIGYYESDGFSQPTPSMKRAVQQTKQLLEKAGHKLIPFSVPRTDHMVYELFFGGIFADGIETLHDVLKNEMIDPCIGYLFKLSSYPALIKRILSFLLKPMFPRLAKFLEKTCGVGSVKKLWKQQYALKTYQHEFIDKWTSLELDVILCPAVCPAFNLASSGILLGVTSYTFLYNVLNFPAGIVPVGTVTKEDEEELKQYRGYYHDFWDTTLRKIVEGGVGLPTAVQCVALPWRDELCLRLMKEVETVTQEWRRHK